MTTLLCGELKYCFTDEALPYLVSGVLIGGRLAGEICFVHREADGSREIWYERGTEGVLPMSNNKNKVREIERRSISKEAKKSASKVSDPAWIV